MEAPLAQRSSLEEMESVCGVQILDEGIYVGFAFGKSMNLFLLL